MTVTLPVFAQTGNIQGTVYQQSTEKTLAGADVRITETGQTQKTDKNGVFRFIELPVCYERWCPIRNLVVILKNCPNFSITKETENENLKRCATRSNRDEWTTECR